MPLTETANYLNFAGLFWDIAGACLLGKGLLASNNTIGNLAGSGWGGLSFPLVRSGCEQRINTRFGLSILVIGFVTQAVSGIGITLDFGWSIALALSVFVPIGWLFEHYRIWVLQDTLRVLETCFSEKFDEKEIRETFADYSELDWKTVTINTGHEFATSSA